MFPKVWNNKEEVCGSCVVWYNWSGSAFFICSLNKGEFPIGAFFLEKDRK